MVWRIVAIAALLAGCELALRTQLPLMLALVADR
jgi:hypothetical protein